MQNSMTLKTCTLLLILIVFISSSGPPSVRYVSSSVSTLVQPYGSLAGGTKVYIFGNNFGTDPTAVAVYFGPYPCNLDGGSISPTSIACITTAATNPKSQWNQPLIISIFGQNTLTSYAANCVFTYTNSATPLVQELIPRTVKQADLLNVFGLHRITDTGDGRSSSVGQVKSLLINGMTCSLMDVVQEPDMQPNSRDFISCQVMQGNQAGEYNFQENVQPGYANSSIRLYETSLFTGKTYQIRLAPQITSDFPHTGGLNGQRLTLTLTGYSTNTAAYDCYIAGQPCQVNQINTVNNKVYVQVPPYNDSNTNFGQLPKDPNDNSTQFNAFLGSNGFSYTRYKWVDYNTLQDWAIILRGNNSLTVQQSTIIYTELGSGEVYGTSQYLQYLTGYLYIPIAGNYTFYALADDGVLVNLAKYQNNSNPLNLQTIIQIDSYVNDHYCPFIKDNTKVSAEVQFTSPGYYYMEIVSINNGGPGYFKVMMSMPNPTNVAPANPTWQVDYFGIKQAGLQPEVINVTVNQANLASKQFSLYYYITGSTPAYLQGSSSIGRAASSSQFLSALNALYTLSQYQPTVNLTMYDGNWVQTNNKTKANFYVYMIIIAKWRDTSKYNLPFVASEFVSAVSIATVHSHSAPIAGTFRLFVGSKPLLLPSGGTYSLADIPYNIDLGTLTSAFNNLYGTNEIAVTALMGTKAIDSIQFVVQYLGVSSVPQISIQTTGLTGGINNKFNTNYTVQRTFSSSTLYYDPIPYEFLRQAVDKSGLYLTINKIPAVCTNCAYTFNNTLLLSVTAAYVANSQLLITLSNPNSIAFSLSDISVSFLGVALTLGPSSTMNSLVCNFPITPSGSPQIPAGTGKPIVHIASVGYAYTDSIGNISITIQVHSFYPQSSSPTGLIPATITGSGFPHSISTGSLSIQLCGNQVTIFQTVQADLLKFLIPPQGVTCASGSSFAQINGIRTNLTFSYDPTLTPLISSIYPTSSSPVMKETIVITGSNFGNFTNTGVFLYDTNGTMQYQLTVQSVASTQITCILGGGHTGDYYVRVLNKNQGLSIASTPSLFQYQIFVDSITPSSGSLGGGYNITIMGQNFATMDATNVLIGSAMNSICIIVNITSTTIVCTMPMIDPSYNTSNPQEVVVTGRIVQKSLCRGSCSFSYSPAQTNNVSKLTNNYYSAGFYVTVNGFDLTGAVPTLGGQVATIIAHSATSITFQYPSIMAGTYAISLMSNNGYAYPPLMTITSLFFNQKLQYSAGSYNGHIINITGNGMTSTLDDGNIFTLKCPSKVLPVKRLYAGSSVQTVEIPSNPSTTDTTCLLNITQGKIFQTYNYSYQKSLNNLLTATLSPASLPNQFYLTKADISASFQVAWAVVLDSTNTATNSTYQFNITSLNSTAYLLNTLDYYLPAGNLLVRAHSNSAGYAIIKGQVINIPMSTPTGPVLSVSYAGAASYSITGFGFINNEIQNNYVSICGLRALAIAATNTSLEVQIPPLITSATAQAFGLRQITTIVGTPYSDTSNATQLAFDGNTGTYSSSTSKSTCFIGVDFGANSAANITTIKYMGNPQWPITSVYLTGAVFEGSNDNITWNTIFTVDNTVHTGMNFWINKNIASGIYRYVQIRHNATSRCQIAELQFTGQIYSTYPVNPTTITNCPVVIILAQNNITVSGATIQYSPTSTSTIHSITPPFGPSVGGTTLQLQGTNFASTISVVIDGIVCVVVSNTPTSITCVTGIRRSPPSAGNSFVVKSNGNQVILACDPYLYIDRWSSQDTWGGEAIPRAGDSILVPQGMTLLVDMSTPILYTVVVNGGRIIFSDEQDMTFDCYYFVLNGGQFRAGMPEAPYQHKLTFTLYGDYYDKQLPMFGNKMIACYNCIFNMHGQVRNPTWTDLNATVKPGDTTITLSQPVDWLPGQSIAVASSSFDHYQSEEMVIASKTANNKTLTLTKAFQFRHFAGVETYGGEQFFMRAEVGLLTRNIKMQGDPTSGANSYGSHLMLTGKASKGLDAKLSYSEFTDCGQPRIVGRYCTHFHMAGEVPNSFVRGISVHNSFARLLTIHGTHYLLVEKNVGFRIHGHNIFVEDGIETKNIIQYNLMISTITSVLMLQSDISVASYWITNPDNTVIYNRAAGGDFYGFWYEIKPNPDGPSATPDICPTGMQVSLSANNIAHSNTRFGLRIFVLASLTYPCLPPQNQSLIDPYSANPSIESRFQNYTLWKNQEYGFLGEQLGHVTIDNFKVIDNGQGGINFYETNITIENVVANNSIVVGYSVGNGPLNLNVDYANVRGIVTSRTDGLFINNTQFYNFGATMTPLQSCSQCHDGNLWVTGGKTTIFRNVTYTNVSGDYIFWQIWRRQIFIDVDGTLTLPALTNLTGSVPQLPGASITPYRPSLNIPNHCYRIANPAWNDSVYCNQELRAVLFTNANPAINFQAKNIKVKVLSDPYENLTLEVLTQRELSIEPQIIVLKHSMDIPASWAMPFASGYYYNVHWQLGEDFIHMSISPSRLWTDDDGIVLRFNYTAYRQFFQIGKWYQQKLQLPYIVDAGQMIYPRNCSNGDYFFDKNNSYLFLCVSGRNKTIREWTDLNGVACLYACPTSSTGTARENFTRLWSETSNWPNNVLPKAGQNVTILQQWNLLLDIDTPVFNYVEVKGHLYFNQQTNNLFQANYIWVKGKIIIGSKANPYVLNATIVLYGTFNSPYLVVDPGAQGNKMMVVTGGVQFYGNVTDNVWTRLTAIAPAGSTSINVLNTGGWSLGDKLVIGATYSNPLQNQKVVITYITGNTVHFTPALLYEHYGDTGLTIQNKYGSLDTRAAVGLLTRNIKITGNQDAHAWGCQVQIYSYVNVDPITGPHVNTGYAILDGVQFDGCGQYGTTMAGLGLNNIGKYQAVPISTSITRSSIHDCNGMCVYMDNSRNITINNNVFYRAIRYLVYVLNVKNYIFTNNLLMFAHKWKVSSVNNPKQVEDVTCYQQFIPLDYAKDIVSVTKNIAQGCQGQGFIFPFAPCQYLNTYNFAGNTAGSCQVGFILNFMDNQPCVGASGLTAYATQIGLTANPPGTQTQLVYQNMFFTDSGRGLGMKFAQQTPDDTFYVNNSYFAGYSRPNCPTCYSDITNSFCKGAFAIRMAATTIGGQKMPLSKANTGFDIICNQMAFDSKTFFNNVLFQNYQYQNTEQPYCTNMSIFQRHPEASDQVGSAYLTKTFCNNCDKESWGFFVPPDHAWDGWLGGCGDIACTGPNNYIIYDQDGSFMGKPGQILANNSMIGDHEQNCTYIQQWNGHYCQTEDFAVLQYESIAPDYNTRIMWPVYLNYDGGAWTSLTNGNREWQWMGAQPLNLRLARFWSVVKLHQTYNLSYASTPPSDSHYQIQKRLMPTGNNSDWVIIRIHYPLPNSLDVLVTNSSGTDQIIKPYPIINGVYANLNQYTGICGANNFFYSNGTIEFVVNGVNNCRVRVKMSSYVQVSASISVSVTDFYANNGLTSFVSNICAFLGIDPGRLKIVSVRSGSAVVTAYIIQAPSSTSSSTTASNPASTQSTLNSMSSTLSSGLSSSTLNVGFPLLSYNLTTVVFNPDGSIYTSSSTSSSNPQLIIIATVVPIAVIIIGLLVFFMIKRMRSRVFHSDEEFSVVQHSENIIPNESTYQNDKEKYQVKIQEFD